MTEKRRDNKNRILRNGEFQRKDGKYEYKYLDFNGKRHSVYSWKLVDTDKVPVGKRCKESLRTMEKKIQKDLDDGINTTLAATLTFDKAFEMYMSVKIGLKETTIVRYWENYNRYVKPTIGNRIVNSIKTNDIYALYASLFNERKLTIGSIGNINILIAPVFSMLINEGVIRKNPAAYTMKELKKSHKNKGRQKKDEKPKYQKRIIGALTVEEVDIFLDFVSKSSVYKKWLPLFTVLLGTGMRIGECLALQWEDCDFANNVIHVSRNLAYFNKDGSGYEFGMFTTKTDAGERDIDMLTDVKRTLLQIKAYQRFNNITSPNIDGFNNFIFINSKGNPHTEKTIWGVVNRIVKRYNKEMAEQIQGQNLPTLEHFAPHNLRHTFCTRFCENETNLKAIQEIMGHNNVSTTMIYFTATKEVREKCMANLESKIRIC